MNVVIRQMNNRLWARREDCEPSARIFNESSVSRMSEDTKSEELKNVMACVSNREVNSWEL